MRDTDFAARLLSAHREASVRVLAVQPLGGSAAHVARLSTTHGDFLLKYHHRGAPDAFVREAEGLRALREADSGLHVPAVLSATEPTREAPAALITEWLAPPTRPAASLDASFGRGLAALHRRTGPRFGFPTHNYCGATEQDNTFEDDWVTFYGQRRLAWLLGLTRGRRSLAAKEIRTYESLIDRLPDLLGHHPAPVLIHGDLWSGNYLPSAAGPALIDPAVAYADRETDLAMMALFGGFSSNVWDAYTEAYPLPLGWEERRPLYQLYHYLNHYYLFGGGYGQQALRIAQRYA